MNNRNANTENTYPNLKKWCDLYHKEVGIKIHPSSVPTDLVLEDLLEYMGKTNRHIEFITKILEGINEKLYHLENDIVDCKEQLLKSTTPIEQAPIIELKQIKKVKK